MPSKKRARLERAVREAAVEVERALEREGVSARVYPSGGDTVCVELGGQGFGAAIRATNELCDTDKEPGMKVLVFGA